MIIFKVTYENITRRFVMPRETSSSWYELEKKIRDLFGIPQHLQFGLTYKDHEGDIITFSSEPEYKDALLSLELNINKNIKNNKGEDNNNNDDHDDIIKFGLIIFYLHLLLIMK